MNDQTTQPLRLSAATLDALPKTVLRPRYDRQALRPGIVHIGLGNFHRAHQSWYAHCLMQDGRATDWAIIGASVRAEDDPQRQHLVEQDFLTTLIELDPSGTSAEVVGSMIGYLPIEEGHAALIRQLSDPAIRIVSMTVTEGGYFLDPATKQFDPDHPDIQYDAKHLSAPRTAFGAIVAALQTRHNAGQRPFTCQSCDNLPGNGTIMRAVVTGLAQLVDASLADWIRAEVTFPNSMVDCIVPATGEKERRIARSLGVADDVPVTHENFRQWVIEDKFCAGRPAWEDVGATISEQVHDYEAMKLRILNGGHQMVANPAEILGLTTIADAMQHPLIGRMFRKIALNEVAPHVPAVPGMTPAEYVDLIERRFANPAIFDTVRRVAFDGSSRHTGAVLPVIRDAISTGGALEGLALSQALWARMCTGHREDGSVIEANDPVWDDLCRVAQTAQQSPQAWLEQRHFYGDIADNTAFCDAFSRWLNRLHTDGCVATLQEYLEAA